MHVIRGARRVVLAFFLTASAAIPAAAQDGWLAEGEIDVDILFNYYQQDGDHSPVTGGVGTEEMDVVSPVVVLGWRVNGDWTLSADLGADAISSASIDAMDHVSGASRQDTRAFLTVTGTRRLGEASLSLSTSVSNEYDYNSVMAGVGYSRDFRRKSTTLSASLRHYMDTVTLYNVNGINEGEDDRTTTDLSLGLTQVLGQRTLLTAELYLSEQSGFLSTPFYEVVLAPAGPGSPERRVAERLPDSRSRQALGLWLNRSFSKRFVLRLHYRFYDDDWGVQSHTFALEPHFRLRPGSDTWIYPILRYHDQTGSSYFGLPLAFTGEEGYYTADRDLSELTSEKYGFGWRKSFERDRRTGWLRRMRSLESRVTVYERDDGLEAFSASIDWGWRFR